MEKNIGMLNFIGIIIFFAFADALSIGTTLQLASGVWNTWNTTDPANVHQGAFGMKCSNNRLWLVSRRLYRKGFEDPWDPASRGGIISTLNTHTGNWTSHKSYDRLDEDRHGEKLFSLNGRLFMLTYSTKQQKIGYHKLFFWDDSSSRWLETPFDIDPAASTVATNSIALLSVAVPDQSGKVAYFVASSHGMASGGSEMAFSKLDVEFRANVPVKATLKPLLKERANKPTAVAFTAVKGHSLYAFVQHFFSEGYVSEYSFAYVIDLTSKSIENVTLNGAHPSIDYDSNRMFQTKDEIFIVGGIRTVGLGHLQNVKEIWSLNMKTWEWKNTNSTIPENAGTNIAFDQVNSKLYFAGLKEGVKAAQISA